MKVLVIRFSAMGDVALIAPVAHSLLASNQNLHITILTRSFFSPFFYGSERLKCIGVDIENEYNGLIGLLTLFRHLKSDRYDLVVDLHDNIRSRILSFFFRLAGATVVRYDKRRKERNILLKVGVNGTAPLPHVTDMYLEAFKRAGLKINTPLKPLPFPEHYFERLIKKMPLEKSTIETPWIGIAPFAKHPSKVWPLDKIRVLVGAIYESRPDTKIFFFGGGSQELMEIEKLTEQFPTAINIGKLLNLKEQLALIASLEIMISMDSSNMHMAAVLGVKVISIWGGTHPAFGFAPLFNEEGVILPLPGNDPVSIFGKVKNQYQLQLAQNSLNSITPERVLGKFLSER